MSSSEQRWLSHLTKSESSTSEQRQIRDFTTRQQSYSVGQWQKKVEEANKSDNIAVNAASEASRAADMDIAKITSWGLETKTTKEVREEATEGAREADRSAWEKKGDEIDRKEQGKLDKMEEEITVRNLRKMGEKAFDASLPPTVKEQQKNSAGIAAMRAVMRAKTRQE